MKINSFYCIVIQLKRPTFFNQPITLTLSVLSLSVCTLQYNWPGRSQQALSLQSAPSCLLLFVFNKARKTILINKRNNFQCTLLQKQQANVPNETHAPTFLVSPPRHWYKDWESECWKGWEGRGAPTRRRNTEIGPRKTLHIVGSKSYLRVCPLYSPHSPRPLPPSFCSSETFSGSRNQHDEHEKPRNKIKLHKCDPK